MTAEQIVTVRNSRGLHLVPCCAIADAIRSCGMRVRVGHGNRRRMVSVKAPISILEMAFLPGDSVRVYVEGNADRQTHEVCNCIAGLFSKEYDLT